MCCDNVKPAYKPVIGCGVGMLIVVLGALGISIYNIEAIRHLQDEMKNKNQVVYYLNPNTTDTGSKSVLSSSKPLSGIVPLDTKNVATVSNNLPNASSSPSSSVNNNKLSDTNINVNYNFSNYTNSSFEVNSTYLSWINDTTNENYTFTNNISESFSFVNLTQTNFKPIQRIIKLNKSNDNTNTTNTTNLIGNNDDDNDEFVTVFCNGIRVTDNIQPLSNIEVEYHDDHLIIICNGRRSRVQKTKKPNTVVFKNGKKILENNTYNQTTAVIKSKPTNVPVKPKPLVSSKTKPTKAIRVITQSSNLEQKPDEKKVTLKYRSKNQTIKLLPILKHLTNYAREKPMINIKLIKHHNDSYEYDDSDEDDCYENDDDEYECEN